MGSSRWARVALLIALLSYVVTFAPMAVAMDGAVTEADAIRLFLKTTPRLDSVRLIEQSAGAERRMEASVENPSVAFEIEDAGGVRDEILAFQQELPVNGRRGLLHESAQVASRAAGLAARRNLQADAHTMRGSFYEVLYRERGLDRLERGAVLLDRIVEILRLRETEGEGSGYDLLRAEQELAEIRMMTAEAKARLSSARSLFGSFFDPARSMEAASLEGDFRTDDPIPDPDVALEQALLRRPDLRALAAQEERHELERRAARRRRFPEPTLSAGWKRTESLGFADTGFVASLTVPLPLFNRGRYSVERATADRLRTGLEAEILKRKIRAEIQSAVARERAARQAARTHGEAVERRAEELREIAQLAYDEGESGILELLDAHRTSLGMELRALAVRYEATSARIERDRAIGIEVKP